jgi:hypothetical protein
VNAVRATVAPAGTASAAAPPPPPTAGEPPTLLADPLPASLAGADPLSLLYFFEGKDRQLGVEAGTKKISALQDERHKLLHDELKAIQQAIDAQKNRSFWDDLGSVFGEVAKVAAVVASVAAAVVSCGAATPIAALAIAGAVLSTAAMADGEFHVLHALGVDDATAGSIDLGMSIGGVVMSLGAGMLAGGTAATGAASTLSKGSAVVAGAGAIGSSAAKIEAGNAQADGERAAADEALAAARSDHTLRLMQLIINDAQNSDQQSEKIMKTIIGTESIQQDTTLTAATAVRG